MGLKFVKYKYGDPQLFYNCDTNTDCYAAQSNLGITEATTSAEKSNRCCFKVKYGRLGTVAGA